MTVGLRDRPGPGIIRKSLRRRRGPAPVVGNPHNGDMALSLPHPSTLVDLAISTAGKAVDTASAVASAPARLLRLLDSAEVLVVRVTTVIDAAERAIEDVQAITASAGLVVREAAESSSAAGTVIQQAAQTAVAAETLVGQAAQTATIAETAVAQAAQAAVTAETLIGQVAQTAATAETAVAQAVRTAATADELVSAYEPAARRFIEHLSAEEVEAAIRMVDELPKLAEHLRTDIMPILATLDRVGPDIHELLGVTRDLRQAIVGIPGFGMLRRRGEEKDAG